MLEAGDKWIGQRDSSYSREDEEFECEHDDACLRVGSSLSCLQNSVESDLHEQLR